MPDDRPEFIRVRFKDSGTEQSIAKPTAIDEDAYTVLDEDAVDYNGRLIEPQVKSKTGQKAATTKEKS